MALLVTIGSIVGVSTIIGTSAFLFRRRTRNHSSFEEQRKEVKPLTLRGLQDVDRICEYAGQGNVVILGVRDLARLDMIRLKRAIQQLKSYTMTTGGDMLVLGKDFVVVIPPNMKLSQVNQALRESLDNEEDNFNPPEPPTEVGSI
ncbi:MAG: cell division protein SepF [Candidatus Heimdallarchaeota archaeon]